MTADALPWLPECALTASRTAEPVAACIEDWGRAWLVKPDIAAAPPWKKIGFAGQELDGFAAVAEGSGFRIATRPEARLSLAAALFGRTIIARELRTLQDNRLIDHMIKAAIDDLAERLAPIVSPSPTPVAVRNEGAESFALPIFCGQLSCAMRLELDAALLVQLAKRHAGPPRPAEVPSGVPDAVAKLDVRLSAHVGTVRLPFAELEALETGDILLLDRSTGSALPASLSGRRTANEALRLTPVDDRLLLQIERPASQW